MTTSTAPARCHRADAESIIGRSLAVFVLAMEAQSIGQASAQMAQTALWWNLVFGTSVVVSGGWIVVTGILGRNDRPALTVFALAAVIGLALWPLAYASTVTGPPWIWNILGVAVAAVAAAWGQLVAVGYALATAVELAVTRMLPSGGAAGAALAWEDAAYLAIAGLALAAAIQAMRVGAQRADDSAAAAAAAYQASALARARLAERNRLGALLHDSVLTALVSTARAEAPEERRAAARLAAESLRRLDEIGRSDQETALALTELPERLQSVAAEVSSIPVEIRVQLPEPVQGRVPGAARDALLAATAAALDNANRHSGADLVTIRLGVDKPSRRLWVEIRDRGRGFDPGAVSARSLGIRLSIVQRMIDAGGAAGVEAAPARGTSVVLTCGLQQ